MFRFPIRENQNRASLSMIIDDCIVCICLHRMWPVSLLSTCYTGISTILLYVVLLDFLATTWGLQQRA